MAITNTRQAKDFTAGAPNIILKGDLRPKEEKPMKMAGPDYVIKRMEDLLDLGYDYDTAGKLAMDEDAYREAMDKGPIDDYAMGGRVKYQQGGGIMPRLNQLGTGVSSAEEMLQGINQRLQSAESSLGGGGVGTLANLASSTPSVSTSNVNALTLKGPFGNPSFNQIPEQFREGYAEFMKGKPIPIGGQAISSVGLPGGGSVTFPDTGSAASFRDYLASTGFTPPSPLALPLQSSLMQQAMGFADGGITNRENYGLGSLVKSVKKAVKGVVKGVKKNPLLAAAALNFAPMLAGGQPFFGIGGLKGSIKTFGNPLSLLNLSGDKTGSGAALDALKIGGAGGVITGLLSSLEREEGESDQDFMERTQAVKDQLKIQFQRLNPQGSNESNSDYDIRIDAMVANAQGAQGTFAMGGRAGYASGSEDRFMELVSELRERGFSQQEAIEEARRILSEDKAMGGRIMRAMGDTASENAMQAGGIEGLPVRQNSKGVKELDLRETGGFIPPVGVKEKADDIPAMLSNNEFVFTADAVRAAGGGNVNKGAQRMYDLMKSLESKVV